MEHVSHEQKFPYNFGILRRWGTLKLCTMNFRQACVDYQSLVIATICENYESFNHKDSKHHVVL